MKEIKMRKTTRTIVKPAEKTHRRIIPLTLLDRLFQFPLYSSIVFIYKPPEKAKGNAAMIMRESLSKTLVHFYPMAGRFSHDAQIDCNDEGVPYVEAETDSDIKHLGDLVPSPETSILLPTIDQPIGEADISSYPLMSVKVTYFKCGGMSLGFCSEHHAMDGTSVFHFIRSWSEITRGLSISIIPFLDRLSVLHPHNIPQPKFDHPEYPSHTSPTKSSSPLRQANRIIVSIFKLSIDQLKKMKVVAFEQSGKHYSTFALLAGHIWKCVCKARNVSSDQETRLSFPVNGRSGRLTPPLPLGFFGNALFRGRSIARVADLESKPLWYAASKIHERLVHMDNEYLRSVIDHLALLPDLSASKVGPWIFDSPNFQITSWINLGLNVADFGWGSPAYLEPSDVKFEKAYIFSNSDNDSVSVAIALQPNHMERFEKLFYEWTGKRNERNLSLAKL